MDTFEWTEETPVTANNMNEMQNILNNNTSDRILKPDVLYNNISEISETITLSSSAEDYTYIEIHYKDTILSTYNSAKLYNPNGKSIALFVVYNGSSGTNTQFKNAVYSISGTSITLTNNYGIGNLNNNAASITNKTNQIIITRVLGYK